MVDKSDGVHDDDDRDEVESGNAETLDASAQDSKPVDPKKLRVDPGSASAGGVVRRWQKGERSIADDLLRTSQLAESMRALERLEGRRSIRRVPTKEELDRRDQEQDIKLKKLYARGILGLLLIQTIATNVGFFLYMIRGEDYSPPPEVMIAWLTSVVVEIIGIAVVVTRYLFPNGPNGSGG